MRQYLYDLPSPLSYNRTRMRIRTSNSHRLRLIDLRSPAPPRRRSLARERVSNIHLIRSIKIPISPASVISTGEGEWGFIGGRVVGRGRLHIYIHTHLPAFEKCQTRFSSFFTRINVYNTRTHKRETHLIKNLIRSERKGCRGSLTSLLIILVLTNY